MAERSASVRIEEHVFRVFDLGPRDGDPLLLLHGFPQSAHAWRLVWPALVEAGLRVLVPDQRGYSPDARPQGVEEYAMPHLLGDALGVLDAFGVSQAHVVGHDWGAALAWQLASRNADRVRTLTAVSVPHPLAFLRTLREDADQQRRSRYLRSFRHDSEIEQALLADGARGLRAFYTGAGPEVDVEHDIAAMSEPGVLSAALNWYRAGQSADAADLDPVTVPTLYVWSDGDRALGPVAAERTAEHVEGPYRFEVLPGISHFVPEEAPERLAELILEHVRLG